MVARRQETPAPPLRGIGNPDRKKILPPLSVRDQKIIACLLMGKSETATGKEFGLSQTRVNEIRNTPGALAYMAAWATSARAETYGMVIHTIRARIKNALESGTDYVDWDSLIKLAKVLEPKETPDQSAYEFLHAEAERIADEMGLTPEGRAKILQFVRESA